MPSEWPEEQIGSFAAVKGGKRMPAGTALIPNKTSHPYLRIVDFRDGGIDQSGLMYVPEAAFPQIARYVITHRDVYISIVGTIGLVGQIPESLDGANLTENAAKITSIHQRVHPKFLAYFLRSQEGQQRISTKVVGSTQPKLALFRIEEIKVPVPPLVEQTQIVAVLGALDDKIALLRETNATLEAIAQALFKSWFVDFDPVRAKAEGRDPEGVPTEVADLFPSEFEDSELGAIPKEWRVGTFADITHVVGGATPSTKEPAYWEDGRHCWATPKDLSGMDTPVLLDTERNITDAGLSKISSGLLPTGSVLMSSRAPIGYLAIAEVPVAVNQGFIAMKPKAGISNLFLLNLLRVQMDEIKSHANGSTFMEVSKAAFRPLKVVVPPTPAIQAFDDVARSLYERMVGNVRQIDSLTNLRDTLLPRLMSGKLRIPQAGVLQ